MTATLADASIDGGWHGAWDGGFQDFLIDRIGPDSGTSFTSYWGTVLNFQPTMHGGCQEQVGQGDEALFALGDVYSQPLLKLSGPARAATGVQTSVTVTDGKSGTPVSQAGVGGAQTGADGTATITFASPGLARLKAEAPAAIRSNALKVCVSTDGNGDCGVPPEQLGTPGASGRGAKDSKAPQARISGLRDGARYARGPRLLKGTASDDGSGVSIVKLALRQHVKGHCRWWSGRRERFVGSNCHKKFFFGIGSNANWSYQLSRSLPPGRYVLDVKAFDRARNRDEKFVRGRNRIVFYVT